MQRNDELDRRSGGADMKQTRGVSTNARGHVIAQCSGARAGTGSYDFWREAEIRYQQTKKLMDDMCWISPLAPDSA